MLTIYEAVLCFFIYAILGWCVEVIYATVNSGKFVNRGFLNGPYCPIYGFGVLIVVICLTPVSGRLLPLFLGSVGLTTALELVTGFLLEKIFHAHWWDYSNEPFQLGGYICAKFSLLWGIACVLVIRVVHPVVMGLVHWLPRWLGLTLVAVFSVAFAADLAITVAGILHIRSNLRLMNRIAKELHNLSDAVGENLSDGVMDAMERTEKSKQELALRRELTGVELDELKAKAAQLSERYRTIMEERTFWTRRMRRAFPQLGDQLRERMKERLRRDR